MSISTQVLPLSAPRSPDYALVGAEESRLTLNGILTFIIGASLVAAGFNAGRFEFGGLKVHPYLLVVAVIFVPLVATRLRLFPIRLVLALSAFAAFYFASTFVGGIGLGEGLKAAAAVATILTMAMLVRSRQDFIAGALGMTLAIGSLAVRGLRTDISGGLEAIESANRNAYSLYALPCVLLSGFILLRVKNLDLTIRGMLWIGTLAVMLGIALNLNRSGWLGLALIGTLLVYERSFKAALVFAVFGAVMGVAVSFFFDVTHVQERLAATKQGLSSDDLRWQLIVYSIEIGLENPLFGVSPHGLGLELASRFGAPGALIETHNVYAHVFAASGVICMFLMFHCGYLMWTHRSPRPLPPKRAERFREARRLLRYMLTIWLLRGFFTHEILYSPAFCMGIGLCMGLCTLPLSGPLLKPRRAEGRRDYRSAELLGVS